MADTAAPGAAERMVAMGVQWTYSNIGVAAALAGDTVRAEEALRRLELILGPSRQIGLRTRVVARLGRREEAVRLMNEVLSHGDRAHVWVHAAIDYAPLHGYPGFEALLRPRG